MPRMRFDMGYRDKIGVIRLLVEQASCPASVPGFNDNPSDDAKLFCLFA